MTTAQQVAYVYSAIQVIGTLVTLTFIVLVVHVVRHWNRGRR